jgi:hypothetical protein
MRIIGLLAIGLMVVAGAARAQTPDAVQPVGTMGELMVSMVYPAANDLLLFMHRGGPKDEKEWVAVQRSAVVLGESGNLLLVRGPRDQSGWIKSARMLVDAGLAAYKAARARDANALLAVDVPLNAACIACHKQYRPNVHPKAP